MTEPTTWGDLFKPIKIKAKAIQAKAKLKAIDSLKVLDILKHKEPEPEPSRYEKARKEFLSKPVTPDAVVIPDPSTLMSIEQELEQLQGMVVTDRRRGRPPVFNTPKTKGVIYVCIEAASEEYLEALNRRGYEVRDIKDMPR